MRRGVLNGELHRLTTIQAEPNSVFGQGFAPNPAGEITALTPPPVGWEGDTRFPFHTTLINLVLSNLSALTQGHHYTAPPQCKGEPKSQGNPLPLEENVARGPKTSPEQENMVFSAGGGEN